MTKSIYLIQGDSLFLGEKTPNLLRLFEKAGTLETESIRLVETEFGDILAKVRNKPFFAQLQVFMIPDADELSAADLDLLENYLQNPATFSSLVFQWNEDAKEPYGRPSETLKRLESLVRKAGGVHETAPEGRSLSQSYIRSKLQGAGKKLSPQAMSSLETLGQDYPALLDSVIENLILSAGEASEITAEMVEAFEENRVKGNRFKFLDAILARRPGEALDGFQKLMESGDDDPIVLTGFLHSQFRQYWQAQLLAERGFSEAKIFSELKINPRRGHFFGKQMRLFSRLQLETALEGLFALDRNVKTGEEEVRSGLEKWIARTAGMNPAVRANF